jgi:hypothetical protein
LVILRRFKTKNFLVIKLCSVTQWVGGKGLDKASRLATSSFTQSFEMLEASASPASAGFMETHMDYPGRDI